MVLKNFREALRNFLEAPRSFREVFWGNVDAVAGHRGALGCDFLARGGTEYACRAKKGFLRYATRFLNPAVLKTGFWGTEGIFGTGNTLLRYGTHLQRRRTADSADCGQPSATPNAFSDARRKFGQSSFNR